MRLRERCALLTAAGIFLLLGLLGTALAQKGSFRSEFISNYTANRLKQQVALVQKNKAIIPNEVKSLISDALSEDKNYEQRMHLLNIAQAMASMHKHWNDDGKPLTEVNAVLKVEIEKEKKTRAELEKWKKYEKFLGNFVMKEHEPKMDSEGLTPVIYPHWVHRIWFKCKVCHQDIFITKKGANDISQEHILEGRQCGVCHNGEMAFGADEKESCVRCHIAGRPEADRLYDMDKVDHEKIKEVAERVGAEWRPENLAEGKIPLDRFGFIDWLEMKDKSVFNPIASLKKDYKDEVRDNIILFETKSLVLSNTLFDHRIHSTWIKCSTCHPALFSEELGGNEIRMKDMAAGKFCGHCHGKVSFTFADCLRCHSLPKGETKEGALIRHATP